MPITHPLDNVIYRSLTTRHASLAESYDEARKFPREVTSLGGFLEPTDRGYESMAGLLGEGEATALFLDHPYEPRPGWALIGGAPLLQMVHLPMVDEGAAFPPRSGQPTLLELSAADSPEMVELATLTKPGPFGKRTHELGTFLGIRDGGKLVAIAGERLKVPGYTEVSAVCTHPERTGKGYAGILMTEVIRRIRDCGETPFLHVRADNDRAIDLYKRLGFRERARGHYAVLKKTVLSSRFSVLNKTN